MTTKQQNEQKLLLRAFYLLESCCSSNSDEVEGFFPAEHFSARRLLFIWKKKQKILNLMQNSFNIPSNSIPNTIDSMGYILFMNHLCFEWKTSNNGLYMI